TLCAFLPGLLPLISFGVIFGLITFIAARKRLGTFQALLLAITVAAIYIGLSIGLSMLGGGTVLTIIMGTAYALCATMGFCTMVLNYGITQGSIINLARGVTQLFSFKKGQSSNSKNSLQKKLNYPLLVSIATLSCVASGVAIGGLTYISIMALPAAFGFSLPFIPLLCIAIFVSLVSTSAMIPLLIKQCLPYVEEWSNLRLADIPHLIEKQFRRLFIFDTTLYADTRINRVIFYTKSVLLILIIPAAIVGSVLTMLQATDALSAVITAISKTLPLRLKNQDISAHAEITAKTVLGFALLSDLIFSVSTVVEWMKFIKIRKAPVYLEKHAEKTALPKHYSNHLSLAMTKISAATVPASTSKAITTPPLKLRRSSRLFDNNIPIIGRNLTEADEQAITSKNEERAPLFYRCLQLSTKSAAANLQR
ncbi:MAG TPA: hypothetical protein VD770_00470, partial [Coxiellaceae bacterium]|nr:hypothetical protein [Coxiellaceae bacterium]